MKYIVYKKSNNRVYNDTILDQPPSDLTDTLDVARCETIPTLKTGEYLEVFNVQEHTETYTEKEPKEVKKVDEQGNEYTDIEYEEVKKERSYHTCELKVVELPNKAQLIEEKKIRDYENMVSALIRKKYSLNAELAILRQRDTKQEEYEAYDIYAEECKAIAKQELGNN